MLGNSGLAAGFIALVIVLFKAAKVVAVDGILALDSARGSAAKFFANLAENDWYDSFWEAYHELPGEIGVSIASLWLLLIFSRQWRSEPIWYDLLSRILGVFWIVIVPFSWCSTLSD